MEIPAHVARIKDELEQLNGRLGNLNKFIDSNPLFDTLDLEERLDMRRQEHYMNLYQFALQSRYNRAMQEIAPKDDGSEDLV